MRRRPGDETRRHGSPGKRQLVHFYGCATNRRKGEAVCANRTVLRHELLDTAVINSMVEILHERIRDGAIDRAIEKLRAGETQHLERRKQIERELSLVQARISRALNLLLDDKLPVDEIQEALKADSCRKLELAADLERLDALGRVAQVDVETAKAKLRKRVDDVVGLLSRQTAQARQMMRALLPEPIRFEPIAESGRRGYRFTGTMNIEHVIVGEAAETHLTVVAPTGFEPVFQS